MPAGASMSQTVKPDRPIWPPVPEPIVPPGPTAPAQTKRAAGPEDAARDPRPVELPAVEATVKPLGFEGFGSFAG